MPTQFEISINPTSANGDILTTDGSSRVRFGASTTANQIITAVSSAASGLEWKTYGGAASTSYILIASSTVTASGGAITISNIPSGYTDLQILITAYDSNSGNLIFDINSNTNSVYSATNFTVKDASAASAGSQRNRTDGVYASSWYTYGPSGGYMEFDIMNYSTSSYYKPILMRVGAAGGTASLDAVTVFSAGTFRSTSAITSIRFTALPSSPNLAYIAIFGIKRFGQ